MPKAQDQPLAEIVEALRSVLCQVGEPDLVLETILQEAVVRTAADRGLIAEVLDGGAMEYRVMKGFRADHFQGDVDAFSRSLFRRVVESGEELMLERAANDDFWNQITSVHSLQTQAILCMPVRVGDRVAAVVHLENRRPGHFRSEHRDLLRSLFAVAGPVMESMRVGRQVIAERDTLRDLTASLRQEVEESRDLLTSDCSFGRFVGRSAPVRRLQSEIRKAVHGDGHVILIGETGTGKSILARVLHHSSPRAKRPFVTASCPNFTREMIESELFGHVKGAFTGAATDRAGKVEAADGGTLFLDEIGDLPLEIQPKLLRFLDRGNFERLGDSRERNVQVRIVAATSKDLDDEIRQGRFRKELYYRLNGSVVHVPPLRDRREDIPSLLRYCLDQTESGRWIDLTAEAVEFLQRHPHAWPGNVREVEGLARRLVGETAEGGGRPVTAADIERNLEVRDDPPGTPDAEPVPGATLKDQTEAAERALILRTIREHPTLTREQQAQKLGISPATLFVKLRKYAIDQ